MLTLLFFVVWIIFFDQNNLIDRIQSIQKIHSLEKEKVYYQKKIEEDKRKLNELRTDRENLEKFAREQYYMKKDDEDIFVLVE
jgi:cell division protein DivIC